MKRSITLITDGACSGNPGPGGWACLVRSGAIEKMLSGAEPETTNNRMELLAVIRGLEFLEDPCSVLVVSDSQYVINAFEKDWLGGWLAKNWKNSQNQPVKNRDLWETLLGLSKIHTLKWEWVRGHSGHKDNERVDQAAREAIKSV